MKRRSSRFLNVVALIFGVLAMPLLLPNRMAAQFTTASLSGTVVDQTGAAVPDAKVTVQNIETGFTQTVNSGPAGDYLFSRLTVGKYKLTVEKAGLTTYVQSGIELAVNQAATQKITMTVGAVSQEITISENTSLVTTESATVSQVVNQRQIVDLPLDGRQVQSLVFLSAGITDTSEHYCGAMCEGGTYPGQQYAKANGTMAESVNYQMDGVAYNDTYINTNLPFPNPDAVQEFSVQDSNLSAEYGNAVGGVVNVVSKSGTNQIHGGVFEFLRNGALNARNFFAEDHDSLKRNQFGASIGGPIKKDHLFYFGTYQGSRYRNAPQGQIAFVPTAAERAGDFSDLLPDTQLVDPTNGQPFAGNKIDPSRFNAASQFFLKSIPLPNGPGRQITYLGPSLRYNDDQFMIKVDYTRGKNQLTGRYFFTNFNEPPFLAKDNLLQVDSSGNQVRVQNIAVTDTYTATPHLLFNTWFGWDRQYGGSLSGAPFCMPDAGVNIAATTPCELQIGIDGGFGISSNHYGAFNRGDQTYREDVTYIKGKHELHFGGEALRIRAPMANTFEQNGEFYFFDNLSHDNITDFMLGDTSLFIQAGGLYLNFTGIKWSAFVQDNWRATSRLTINMGLRWDPWFPYKDSKGRVGCFEPGQQSQRFPNSPPGLIFGGDNHDPGCPSSSMKTRAGNFAPRLGFAYKLTNDGKTSVRGGAGLYYAIPNTVAFQDVVGIPPFAPIINLTAVDFNDPYGSAGVSNPFPAQFGGINKAPGKDAPFPEGPISFTQIFDPNFRLPVIALWNLTLERQLAGSWLVRAAYVGNKGTHLFGTNDQETGLAEGNPAIYIPGQSTVDNEQSRRRYPNFAHLGIIDSAINSNYNSLQLTVEKSLSHGLSLLANYAWSKELNDFAPVGAYNSNTNPFNRHFDYGISDDDVGHAFKLSGMYQFPHVGVSGPLDRLVNGWELTSILRWQGGFPFSIFSGYDNSFSGVNEDRADFTGTNIHQAQLDTGRSHGQLIQQWFNTSLFAPNAPGTYGNTGKNILRGPRTFVTNLALVKDTKIMERMNAQFRAEAFNVFNNVNFGTPDHTQADGQFGQITGARDPRILQFALKIMF
jgi:carboxypeptidase family protein